MSFLFPTLLFLGILAAVPFIIHLFGERNYRPLPFSSLKFLREIERESMQRLQWQRWLILLLRALFILMLVFILAQPFFNRANRSLDKGLIILDKSYSTQIDPDYIDNSDQLIQALNTWDLIMFNEHSSKDSLLLKVKDYCENYSGVCHVIFVSDFQQNEQNRNLLSELNKLELSLYVLPLTKQALSISIVDLQEKYIEDSGARKISFLLGKNKDVEQLSANVYVNSKRIGKAYNTGSGYIDYHVTGLNDQQIFCMVEGPQDDYPEDNKRYLILNKKNNIRILLVDDQNQNSTYVYKALSAMENVDLKLSSMEDMTKEDLNNFDMIWLNAFLNMQGKLQDRILAFSQKHPVVLSVSGEKSQSKIWEKYSGKLKKESNLDGYMNFRAKDNPESSFKVNKYFKTDKENREHIWELDSGEPILFRSSEKLYVLLSPLDFKWNEMGLSPYFLQSLNQFIIQSVDNSLLQYELGDVVDLGKGFVEVTTPGGSIFNVKEQFTHTDIPGFYMLKSDEKEWSFAVNPAKDECEQLMMDLASYDILEYDREDPKGIAEQIRGRKGQTLFFLFAMLCIIFELLLIRKGESTE